MKMLTDLFSKIQTFHCVKYDYVKNTEIERKEICEKTKIEAARSFYANGASVELIANSLNMKIEQVREILNESDK